MSELGGQGIKGVESGAGENNTGANVGIGIGLIFRDKTGVIINFKSLIAGSGMTINNNVNDIELIASGAGEANTISSIGGGTVQLVATVPKVGDDLRTKSLSVTAPINVSDVADLITLGLDPLVNADISATAAILLSKLQDITTDRLLGREAAGAGAIEELTLNATLELIAGSIRRAALTGDVTAPAGSNATTIAALAVTFAKIQNIATDRLLGREAAGAGSIEEISLDATLELIAAATLRRAAITGDISIPAGSNVATYDPLSIVNADVSLTAAILQSKLDPIVNANLPIGTAFQRKRTNAGATAIEDFTEQSALYFVIGNGVDVITTGVKVHLLVPFDLEIIRWTLLGKESGSIVVDVNQFTSLANFDADTKVSITGTDTPDLVADRGDDSTLLTGWTTVLAEGIILEAEVDSITTITRATLILTVRKRG